VNNYQNFFHKWQRRDINFPKVKKRKEKNEKNHEPDSKMRVIEKEMGRNVMKRKGKQREERRVET
jgi:hypothetical protein